MHPRCRREIRADFEFRTPARAFIYICSRQLRFVSPNKSSLRMQNRPFIFKILYHGPVEKLIYSASIPASATNPNDATHPSSSSFHFAFLQNATVIIISTFFVFRIFSLIRFLISSDREQKSSAARYNTEKQHDFV